MTRFLLSFNAFAAGLSGGDRHLLESAARWREHVDVEVVAPPNAKATIAEFLGDARFTPLGSDSDLVTRGGAVLAAEYIRRAAIAELRPKSCDVVVAASHFLPDAATVHAAVRRGASGVAFVYHLVAGRTDRSLRTRWSRADEALGLRLLRKSAATIFTSNDETAAALERQGMHPIRTNVGLDLASFRRTRTPDAAPVVLFMARLVPKKGLLDVIAAWPAILQRVPEARLAIAGSGPERGAAERLVHTLGVGDSVEWHGFVSEAEKRDLLFRARVFAAPSYEEGWGIAVAEAMASGLPVVAYELPTLAEVFGQGYVGVAKGSVDDLAAAVSRLLADPGEAERVAVRGTSCVAAYDVSAIAEQELQTILSRAEVT